MSDTPPSPRRPIRKVRAGGLAGLVATAIVAAADFLGAGIPESLAALLTALATAGAAYLTHSTPQKEATRPF